VVAAIAAELGAAVFAVHGADRDTFSRQVHGVLTTRPTLAVDDAATKHLFDNRYGTGQPTRDGILRATNILLAGKVFVVVGYGWCGRGPALRARGMGARVVVCIVLAEGRLVGQSCAEASPAEVMDLTFATQALAVTGLATAADPLPPGLHPVPAEIEERVTSWPPSGSAATTSRPPRRLT
jgi:S-adenosylhomocysteine hydrolase